MLPRGSKLSRSVLLCDELGGYKAGANVLVFRGHLIVPVSSRYRCEQATLANPTQKRAERHQHPCARAGDRFCARSPSVAVFLQAERACSLSRDDTGAV